MFCGQLHMGTWLITLQRALLAHAPRHGFSHLFRKQALSLGQSEFRTHSGRQPAYGFPWNSDKHVHSPLLHWAFAPHGDGLHLSWTGFGSYAEMICFSFNFYFKLYRVKVILTHTELVLTIRKLWECLHISCKLQLSNGFPVYPSGQLHTGMWFVVIHLAPKPQEPGQGSLHFSLIHAILLGHSGFMVHSGLQLGGCPI